MADPKAGERPDHLALRRLYAQGARGVGERLDAIKAMWEPLSRGGAPGDEHGEGLRTLAAAVHKLVGSGGTFGYPEVSRIAASLERTLLDLAAGKQVADGLGRASELVAAARAAFARGPAPDAGQEESGEPAPAAARGDDHRVLVVATGDRITDIVALVSALGFTAVPAAAAGGRPVVVPPGIIAAVIDGSAAGVRAGVDGIVGRVPSVLLVDRVDLDVRLDAARRGIDVVMADPPDTTELGDWLNGFSAIGAEMPFSVLVVDDDGLLAAAYAATLRAAGMNVTATTDPAAVPGLISATFPDLVLMDVQMPGINGIELARVIRQNRRFLSLPIVFLSAEQDETRRLLARRFGGDDFIGKPVDLEHLVALVRLRAERARSLRAAMEHDSLTGLLNHGRFKDRLQQEMERSRRTGAEISLAMIDLDRFKTVNDTYGHLAGDRVIRALARTMRSRLRRIDVIGRYGGEEFAVILLDTAPAVARAALERVRIAFAALRFEEGGEAFGVTFSAGIASSRRHSDMSALIAAADRALYAAKRNGRDRVELDDAPA